MKKKFVKYPNLGNHKNLHKTLVHGAGAYTVTLTSTNADGSSIKSIDEFYNRHNSNTPTNNATTPTPMTLL